MALNHIRESQGGFFVQLLASSSSCRLHLCFEGLRDPAALYVPKSLCSFYTDFLRFDNSALRIKSFVSGFEICIVFCKNLRIRFAQSVKSLGLPEWLSSENGHFDNLSYALGS